MRLHGLRVSRHGLEKRALRSRQILFPKVERPERQLELHPISQVGSRRLEALDGGIHFLARGRYAGQQRESVEVLGFPLEDEHDLLPCLAGLAGEQVDRPELESDVEVVGGELLRLQQVRERLPQLAQLVMRESELLRGACVGWVVLEHVPKLDDRRSVLLLRGELVSALQMAGLLSLRRPGAPGQHHQSDHQEDCPPARHTESRDSGERGIHPVRTIELPTVSTFTTNSSTFPQRQALAEYNLLISDRAVSGAG